MIRGRSAPSPQVSCAISSRSASQRDSRSAISSSSHAGIELAREAKKLRPYIQVMFATGYYSRAKEAGELGTLLFKPMRAHEIETELDRFLRPRGGIAPR
jgi:hypothetical protein